LEKIIFKETVLEYFDDLLLILFEDEYFGFPDSARNYVNKIVDFIFSSISSFPH
jgi:hypothetical protein